MALGTMHSGLWTSPASWADVWRRIFPGLSRQEAYLPSFQTFPESMLQHNLTVQQASLCPAHPQGDPRCLYSKAPTVEGGSQCDGSRSEGDPGIRGRESYHSSPGAHMPSSGCLGNLAGPLPSHRDKPAASHDADRVLAGKDGSGVDCR